MGERKLWGSGASIYQYQRENSQPAAHDGSVMKDTHVQGLRGGWDGCHSISFRKDSAQQGVPTRNEVSRVEFPVGDTCKDQDVTWSNPVLE